jgi:hypothetical protein
MHKYIIYETYAQSLNEICLAVHVLEKNSGQIESRDKRMDEQGDSSIPPQTLFAGGIKNKMHKLYWHRIGITVTQLVTYNSFKIGTNGGM